MDDSIANLKYLTMRDEMLIYSQKVTERDKEITALKKENEKLREAEREVRNLIADWDVEYVDDDNAKMLVVDSENILKKTAWITDKRKTVNTLGTLIKEVFP